MSAKNFSESDGLKAYRWLKKKYSGGSDTARSTGMIKFLTMTYIEGQDLAEFYADATRIETSVNQLGPPTHATKIVKCISALMETV